MSDNSGSKPGTAPGLSSMVSWLGFFLLVFAVAGLGMYFVADEPIANNGTPAAISQNAQ